MSIKNKRQRGSRGKGRGRGPVVTGLHCSACGTPGADPCSEQCRTELEPHDGYEMREAK